jgi:hypothetical protein
MKQKIYPPVNADPPPYERSGSVEIGQSKRMIKGHDLMETCAAAKAAPRIPK